jgi:hypothetical protein
VPGEHGPSYEVSSLSGSSSPHIGADSSGTEAPGPDNIACPLNGAAGRHRRVHEPCHETRYQPVAKQIRARVFRYGTDTKWLAVAPPATPGFAPGPRCGRLPPST